MPYSPEILKQDLSLHNKWVANPEGSNKRAIQLEATRFVTHRSSGTTTPLNEKQSPDESHCIPRTFSDPSSAHLSWNSRMTSSPTWVLLEPHWVRHMPASLLTTLASLVISQACTWSSHPEIQLSTYMLLVSSSTTGEVGYWDKWYLMVAFNRNGLLLLPNGTRVNLITRVTPWSFQKKWWMSRSTGCIYLEESLSNVCTQSKLPTSESHQNTKQIWDQTRACLKTVIQWYIIVTLGRDVEDWTHLGTNTGLFHHRSMRHIIHKAISRYSDLISRDLLNHSSLLHILDNLMILGF